MCWGTGTRWWHSITHHLVPPSHLVPAIPTGHLPSGSLPGYEVWLLCWASKHSMFHFKMNQRQLTSRHYCFCKYKRPNSFHKIHTYLFDLSTMALITVDVPSASTIATSKRSSNLNSDFASRFEVVTPLPSTFIPSSSLRYAIIQDDVSAPSETGLGWRVMYLEFKRPVRPRHIPSIVGNHEKLRITPLIHASRRQVIAELFDPSFPVQEYGSASRIDCHLPHQVHYWSSFHKNKTIGVF